MTLKPVSAERDGARGVDSIAGISSMAVRALLSDLAREYRDSRVAIESVGGVDAERRVREGEALDFIVLARDAIDRLAESGHVDPESRVDLARSGIAVAVRSGLPHFDIGSENALREAILASRSIGYSTGPSGRHLLALLERWGIANSMAARLVRAPAGVGVGTLLASGNAEVGFQQASEFLGVEGIEVIGPLPDAIQSITVFCGATCASASRPDAARRFLEYLASPETSAAKRRYGMTP